MSIDLCEKKVVLSAVLFEKMRREILGPDTNDDLLSEEALEKEADKFLELVEEVNDSENYLFFEGIPVDVLPPKGKSLQAVFDAGFFPLMHVDWVTHSTMTALVTPPESGLIIP